MKQQLLKLQEDIAVTEAKQEVYDENPILDKVSGARSRQRSSSLVVPSRKVQLKDSDERRAQSSDRRKKIDKKDTKLKFSHDKPSSLITQGPTLDQAVIEMLSLSSAHTVELDKFSGSILEFEYFKANFKELVESEIKDQRGRLARLL